MDFGFDQKDEADEQGDERKKVTEDLLEALIDKLMMMPDEDDKPGEEKLPGIEDGKPKGIEMMSIEAKPKDEEDPEESFADIFKKKGMKV